jgi:3-hydroxyisobutyrate dehydrogenase-like beta-hydroxyacid dehydrogenase
MAKVTNVHKYAVLWLHSQQISKDKMSDETGLSPRQIDNIIKKYGSNSNSDQGTQPQPEKKHSPPNLMIMDSGAKKFRVAIMTKDASMANDALIKNLPNPPTNQANYIYRPNYE